MKIIQMLSDLRVINALPRFAFVEECKSAILWEQPSAESSCIIMSHTCVMMRARYDVYLTERTFLSSRAQDYSKSFANRSSRGKVYLLLILRERASSRKTNIRSTTLLFHSKMKTSFSCRRTLQPLPTT